MYSRGKLMCEMILKQQQPTGIMIGTPIMSTQEPSEELENKSNYTTASENNLRTKIVQDVQNIHLTPILDNKEDQPSMSTQKPFNESENLDNHAVPNFRRPGTSSCLSSSSASSSSSESSESSSEDCDDIINDVVYDPKNDEESEDSEDRTEDNRASLYLSTINNPPTSYQDVNILVSPLKKGIKRNRAPEKWKRNHIKKLRNSEDAYETHTRHKKIRKSRKMKDPCGLKCKLQCSIKFSHEERQQFFTQYWLLGEIEKQRQFINNCMTVITREYRYVRVGGTRKPREKNNAFSFIKNGEKIRVCKVFFNNTLDINDRTVRTVQEKRNKVADVLLEPDQRGKHGKHKTLDPVIRDGIRQHINDIPKIESHYTRANTSRTFIDGSRSLAEIHRDYVANCKAENKPYGSYAIFHRLFREEFNISFFIPKKDLCEICVAYENAPEEEKNYLKEKYDQHLVEKNLSREEKKRDKGNTNFRGVVAVYDLQAVTQIPKGNVSVFYYKSKLNVLNFTIYDLQTNSCECYVWDESNGHRGVNELGTCVLKYLQKKATMTDAEIIFYSDNCAGQQKNKFMLALYLYAVRFLGIKSITHKYLIKGHTQNEGDSAHSLIERQVKRQLRSGPMYTPDAFIAAIRAAKKQGEPFNVTELCHEDFNDIKELASILGPMNLKNVKLHDVKVIKFVKESTNSVYYKHSYNDEFQEATIINRKKQIKDTQIILKPAFTTKPGLAANKKTDLLDLVNKNHIPKYYVNFYRNL